MVDAPRPGTGWDAHEREQRLAWMQLTPRQRLDWLWQAKLFARRVAEARQRGAPGEAGPAIGPDPQGPGR